MEEDDSNNKPIKSILEDEELPTERKSGGLANEMVRQSESMDQAWYSPQKEEEGKKEMDEGAGSATSAAEDSPTKSPSKVKLNDGAIRQTKTKDQKKFEAKLAEYNQRLQQENEESATSAAEDDPSKSPSRFTVAFRQRESLIEIESKSDDIVWWRGNVAEIAPRETDSSEDNDGDKKQLLWHTQHPPAASAVTSPEASALSGPPPPPSNLPSPTSPPLPPPLPPPANENLHDTYKKLEEQMRIFLKELPDEHQRKKESCVGRAVRQAKPCYSKMGFLSGLKDKFKGDKKTQVIQVVPVQVVPEQNDTKEVEPVLEKKNTKEVEPVLQKKNTKEVEPVLQKKNTKEVEPVLEKKNTKEVNDLRFERSWSLDGQSERKSSVLVLRALGLGYSLVLGFFNHERRKTVVAPIEKEDQDEEEESCAGAGEVDPPRTLDQERMGTLRVLKDCLRARKVTINDFELFPTVGKGAFGRVRMVRLKEHVMIPGHLPDDLPCMALKILNKLKATQNMDGIGPAMAALKQEVSIMAQLDFPFIVNMITMFHDDKRVMLLMEFVNAGELFKLIYQDVGTNLTTKIAQHFSAELLLTIEEMHNKSIMYRDLKPENVLIDSMGHAKLVDFGLAKPIDQTGKAETNCGTLVYQAPEILLNREYGYGVDWWAFGVMFFELLTRKAPWGNKDDPFDICQAIMALDITYPRKMNKNGKQLVKKFLVHNEDARWGASKKNPCGAIKAHKFFKGVDWQDLVNLNTVPPFKPAVKDDEDITHLEKYPESLEESGPDLSTRDKKLWEETFKNIWEKDDVLV